MLKIIVSIFPKMYSVHTRILVYHGESRVSDDHPTPIALVPDWAHSLIMAFAIVQMTIATFILLAYIFNKNFRYHPGNISVGFAASTLGLSIVWLLNLNLPDDLIQNRASCAWLGFFSLLAEYCSSFYEIGTLYYFYCYFKEIAKPVLKEINPEMENEATDTEGETFIDFIDGRSNSQDTLSTRLSQSQIQSVSGSVLSQSDLLLELTRELDPLILEQNFSKDEETRKLQQQMKKVANILEQLNKNSNKQQEIVNQLSIRSNQILLHMGASSYAALQIQTRIHIFIVIFAFLFVLIPSLTEELGRDFYGVCAIQWEISKQATGIILTILVTGLSSLVSLVILAYFWAKRGIRQKLKKEIERARETRNFNKLSAREEHYVKHLFLYVLCSTVFGLGLAATNVFADSQTNYDSRFTEFCFIIHYLIIAIRGILLLWLKLAEPDTRKALLGTLNSIFNSCTKCFRRRAQDSNNPMAADV